ncbi:MAG: hypothetical protein J5497_07020, partial [Selenomonadaceae bacterium]|nr:hypothetical protein [Selenomonadaceae bacterium]
NNTNNTENTSTTISKEAQDLLTDIFKDAKAIKAVEMIIKELVDGLPIFAEEWLPGAEVVREVDSDLMMKSLVYGTV